jgi:hypothetical protein
MSSKEETVLCVRALHPKILRSRDMTVAANGEKVLVARR